MIIGQNTGELQKFCTESIGNEKKKKIKLTIFIIETRASQAQLYHSVSLVVHSSIREIPLKKRKTNNDEINRSIPSHQLTTIEFILSKCVAARG